MKTMKEMKGMKKSSEVKLFFMIFNAFIPLMSPKVTDPSL
jgi:hypothetical protein